jgi:hypothetical protein
VRIKRCLTVVKLSGSQHVQLASTAHSRPLDPNTA